MAYITEFSIDDKIRFRTKVVVAEHQDTTEGIWFLTVADSEQQEIKVFALRLTVALGLTSEFVDFAMCDDSLYAPCSMPVYHQCRTEYICVYVNS